MKNIPDRIKIILQLLVFTLLLWLLLLFILMFFDSSIPQEYIKLELWGSLAISFIIQFVLFIYRWKNLLTQEKSGDLPDMNDPKNIKPFQMIFVLVNIVLLVAGVTLFQLYSKLAGSLCIIAVFVLWTVEVFYIRKMDRK